VSRIVLASFASALLGAVLGGSAAVWRFSLDAPAAASKEPAGTHEASPGADSRGAAELERRLAAVERAVATLEERTPTGGTSPASSGPAAAPAGAHPIDTPVFEAAVMDIMERAAEGRAEERAAAKDEKRRQRAQHWANELTLQLGLSPAQTQSLLEIQADLDDELERERVRGNAPDAPFASKEQRRAARDAARQSAERRLRALLAPPQLATYEGLDERLKLYRPKDAD
jgi:hypothetical protein